MQVLRAFAEFYRRALNPVHLMIRDALIAMPKEQAYVVSEFYRALVEEFDLARGFRQWWDIICERVNEIDHELDASHMAKEIRTRIDDRIS